MNTDDDYSNDRPTKTLLKHGRQMDPSMIARRDAPSRIKKYKDLPEASYGVHIHRMRYEDHMEGIEYPVNDEGLSLESHGRRTTRPQSNEAID